MDDKIEFDIPVMRVSQREDSGMAIYIGKVKAKDLYYRSKERFKVAVWENESKTLDKGYQRVPNEHSISKIKDYLLKEVEHPLLPTSVLVNSRRNLVFKEIKDGFGYLHVDDTLYIIDGQHRIEALKSMMKDPSIRSMYQDYELPIIVMTGFEYGKEVEEFFVINSRQKRVKTDLAQRIYLELQKNHQGNEGGLIPESKKWELAGVVMVDRLRKKTDLEGFWNDKIGLPDDSRDLSKTRIISQSSFVKSLKPLFIGSNSIWDLERQDQREIIEGGSTFINKYWSKIGELYPEISRHPHDYTLYKTVGVFTLHILLAYVANNTKDLEEAIHIATEKIRFAQTDPKMKMNERFWRSGRPLSGGITASTFSSGAGHTRLATAIYMAQPLGDII